MIGIKQPKWANFITALRLVSAPVLAWLIISREGGFLVLGLLVGAWLTDLLDGALARWQRRATLGGAIFDSLADKTLAAAVVISMLVVKLVTLPQLAMLLTRDIVLLLGGLAFLAFGWRHRAKLGKSALWSGKIVTLFQALTTLAFLARLTIAPWLLYLTFGLAIVAIADYAMRARALLLR